MSSKYSATDPDLAAWQAISLWAVQESVIGFRPRVEEATLVQWFLWDKVGRALRAKLFPEDREFDAKLPGSSSDVPRRALQPYWLRESLSRAMGYRPRRLHLQRTHFSARQPGSKRIFVPSATHHVVPIARALFDAGCELIANRPDSALAAFAPRVVQRNAQFDRLMPRAPGLLHACSSSLLANDVRLAETDFTRLSRQLAQQQVAFSTAESELLDAEPALVLLVADNIPPYQEYRAAAAKLGIPTVSFQHGMDCERYYLDPTYCTYYGAWSQERLNRSRSSDLSTTVHHRMTGNPNYDALNAPERMQTEGAYWLWITRPHTPKFCYSPSRRPREGIDILETLWQALKRHPVEKLVVKPHHNDYKSLYEAKVTDLGANDRITISDRSPNELAGSAKLVIAEDSTSAVEAMFSGKIIIHAHFAQSPPVLSLVEFNAALPAYSPAQMLDSIDMALGLETAQASSMLAGQRACLDAYAGPLDGQSHSRVRDFLMDMLR